MKKIFVLFFIISLVTFGKINDTLNFFNETSLKEINEKIESIEKEKNIKIYVNTYDSDEGFVVNESQNLIILDIIKEKNDKIKTIIEISKDIDLDDEAKNSINELLNSNEKLMVDNKIDEYVVEILNEVEPLIEKTTTDEPIILDEEVEPNEKKYYFIILGVVVCIVLVMILKAFIKKYKKDDKI